MDFAFLLFLRGFQSQTCQSHMTNHANHVFTSRFSGKGIETDQQAKLHKELIARVNMVNFFNVQM